MKKLVQLALCFSIAWSLYGFSSPAFAFDSGSTGADGELLVSQNTELQVPEGGVFNFTTVTVNSGAILSFKANTQNTPVTILATGNVTINGTVSVDGSNGNYLIPGVGGPGGFQGGVGGVATQTGRRGEGPGGGLGGASYISATYGAGSGGGGGFSVPGATGGYNYIAVHGGPGGGSYGNERLLPMIGGSGGGGGGGTSTYVGGAGGGGGGGIVIASSGTILVSGTLRANGGAGADGEGPSYSGGGGGGGAGGGIRLIANTISGDGTITATGGLGGSGYTGGSTRKGGKGAKGRIRFEAGSVTRTVATDPPLSFGAPYAVIPENMPSLHIVSIAGKNVPENPNGSFGTPDILLPGNTSNPISLVVQAVNVPVGSQVTVKAHPQVGSTATGSGPLAGTLESSLATIDLNISTAYSTVITASVAYQLTVALYLDGERVESVRVAATLGGASEMTYITESGREIPVYL